MIRKLIGMVTTGSLATAAPQTSDVNPDAGKIYPYIVPTAYFEAGVSKDETVNWPLGHGLYIALVHDLGGLVRNVQPKDLAALNLKAEEAKQRAIQNLEALAKSGAIKQARFPAGPGQKPFVLFGGHWAAAACILLPDLRETGVKNVGSEEVCVCIPHREALLMFAKGDKAYRDAMRKLIHQNESDGRKPLSFELFELTPTGIVALKE